MSGTVSCGTCKKEYKAIHAPSLQGDRCAASVWDDLIIGHYGSEEIDGEAWEFTAGRPKEVRIGVICDDCVKRLKELGAIRLKYENCWFGLPE